MRKKQLPKRIEILRKAFENKWSLEAVNKELEDNLCERLYARNIYEAGLIYAFCLGFDYENWKQLYTAYEEERKDARYYIQSPEKNIIADRNYHCFVLAGAPAPNIWHKICAKISTANHSPTGVSLPSDIFILYMVDVITTSIVLLLSSIRRRLLIFLIIIQSF